MQVFRIRFVYFKTDSSGPVPLIVLDDGRIDFSTLGAEFRLDPSFVKLNGFLVLRTGVKSQCTWEDLKGLFERTGKYLRMGEDPVILTTLIMLISAHYYLELLNPLSFYY